MAKTSKEELQRYAGAQWAFELIDRMGLEAAKKHLEWRINFGVPLQVKKKDLEDCVDRIKENTIQTVLLMTEMVLHDEFEFEHDDLERFGNRFGNTVDVLNYDLAQWADFQEILEKECAIKITLNKDIIGSKEMLHDISKGEEGCIS